MDKVNEPAIEEQAAPPEIGTSGFSATRALARMASPAADDLDSLLSDYDAAMAPAAKTPPADTPAAAEAPSEQLGPNGLPLGEWKPPVDPEREAEDLRRDVELRAVSRWAESMDAKQRVERDQKDFAAITAAAKNEIKELGKILPENYAEIWFRNQLSIDPVFLKTMNNRYTDETSTHRAEHLAKKMIKQLYEEVRSLPDQGATEDRELVASAVRGTSAKAPPSPPPNYGNMSDGEFKADVNKNFGFDPGIG